MIANQGEGVNKCDIRCGSKMSENVHYYPIQEMYNIIISVI